MSIEDVNKEIGKLSMEMHNAGIDSEGCDYCFTELHMRLSEIEAYIDNAYDIKQASVIKLKKEMQTLTDCK